MNISEIMHTNTLKLTVARKELLNILSCRKKLLCYEDIKDSLSMDKATFYRNMSTFEEKSIVNSFESNDKKRYYELHDTLHSHFVYTQCNNIECLHINQDNLLLDYEINNIIIHGRCSKCKQQ